MSFFGIRKKNIINKNFISLEGLRKNLIRFYAGVLDIGNSTVINIFVDASNIHTGGGKTLLNDFLLSAKNFGGNNFKVWVDRRYEIPKSLTNLEHVNFQQASIIDRVKLKFSLKRLAMKNDIIIYFGNIPPFIKPSSKTILMQNNRFVID